MIPKVSRGLRTLSMGESQPGSNTTGHGPNRHALGSIERMAFFSRCAIRTSNCPNGPVALHAHSSLHAFDSCCPFAKSSTICNQFQRFDFMESSESTCQAFMTYLDPISICLEEISGCPAKNESSGSFLGLSSFLDSPAAGRRTRQ